MDTLFNQFKLDKNIITSLLDVTNGYIAGSATLYSYMINQGETLNWRPSDLDIWIKLEDGKDIESYKTLIEYILKRQNYESVTKSEDEYMNKDISEYIEEKTNYYICENNKKRLKEIIKVLTFIQSDNGKKIQIIFHKYKSLEDNLKAFDISLCAIAWNPKFNFKTNNDNYLEEIKDKKGYILPENIDHRTEKRIEKYKKRGFRIYKISMIEM